MSVHRNWRFLGIALLLVFPLGCVSYRYVPLQNGYGRQMTISGFVHGGTDIKLTYRPEGGRRQTVWPKLASGYCGAKIIHDDLIVFQADWPPHDLHLPPVPGIFAAKGGPPVVDITKFILQAAQRDAAVTRTSHLRGCNFKPTDSGVRIQVPTWSGYGRSTTQEFALTWQEIDDLVTRLRTTGTPHEFEGVKYYAEE